MIVRKLLNRISAEQTESARNRKVFVSDLHGTKMLLVRIWHGTERLLFRICTEQKFFCFSLLDLRGTERLLLDWHGTERFLFRICTEQKGLCFESAPNGMSISMWLLPMLIAQEFYGQAVFITYSVVPFSCRPEIDEEPLTFRKI